MELKQSLLFLFIVTLSGQITAQPETFFNNPANIEYGLFGTSVSINEHYAVVGSLNNQNEDTEQEISFPASVLKKNEEGEWFFQTALVPDDYLPGQENFGWEVAISDENVIVITSSNHLNLNEEFNTGAIYVFELVDEVWTQTANIPNPIDSNIFFILFCFFYK